MRSILSDKPKWIPVEAFEGHGVIAWRKYLVTARSKGDDREIRDTINVLAADGVKFADIFGIELNGSRGVYRRSAVAPYDARILAQECLCCAKERKCRYGNLSDM